jgi:ABC-2 type transport system ATP-binding protein
MNAIEATGLIKRFGERTAVDGLDLTIREGELFSLLGVNGAGKTTTIRLLCCLCRPTAGDARVLGDSIVSAPHKVKEKTNVSPQETAVAPNLSVRENLEFSAGIYGLSKAEAKSSAEKMLRDFGLLEVEKQRAKTLSAASSAGSRSPWRLSRSRGSFFSTNRRSASTCLRGASCGTRSKDLKER